jgi:hypothetical protein
MRFKEFLLNEDGFSDSGSDWFFGNYLRPSDAFDWQYAQPHPADFLLVQSRWEKERKQGRKFHNMNLDGVLKTKFTSVYSNTMPDVGKGFWKHKPDTRPNVTVDTDAKMELKSYNKNYKSTKILTKSNDLVDKTDHLNKTFGHFEPKYVELPKDFDKPWKNKTGRP